MAIDGWTVALQAVNFLILVLLLRHFLYRPVLAMIDRRKAEATRLLDDAALRVEAAKAERQKAETLRADLEAQADALLADSRARAGKELEELRTRARREADGILAEGRKALAEERRAAEADLRGKAAGLAVEIAGRLLAAATPGARVEPFLDRVCTRLTALPEPERQVLAGQAADGGIRIVTAVPLDEAGRAHCRDRAHTLLGPDIALTFADDPELLAGVELHFAHTVIRDSWRDLLGRIGLELDGHDDAHRIA
ncbi:ATP synthase subunit b 1 [Rhodospirillum centenum]|uniref:ATP synthase subunit b 1 n=1 Tax=Rhodospirillum centenum (strain ATCC 51521 / SW) TaxID=414684 RepID=ATPF1_RHOCS|nr:ATP synthase subunit b 1 [Rhodospirillum centenum]B6IQS5.1 RecName: Full=ATP synthase subunit b 1; AltName: Full=ATP synthase F(0) sector subunit b 1; AltName: Full=ATPase subunit I 1; AltName: Full=F-type ATPase subunit b 1; Short=F-ATPase subunit b 1 [Rhodospirillum centenum SW]ACI97811.1 ATP synthase F0, B subunit [Rhodospirillum centenum SW]